MSNFGDFSLVTRGKVSYFSLVVVLVGRVLGFKGNEVIVSMFTNGFFEHV